MMKKGKTVAFKLNGKKEENNTGLEKKNKVHKQTDTPDLHS